MARKDWRSEATKVTAALEWAQWYRSPLWSHDHLLSRIKEGYQDGISWCGRALDYARDWDNEEMGGLWETNRKSAPCAECNRMEKEYLGG